MCILLILSVWGRDYPPASLSASGLIPLISITGFPSVPTVILRVASIVKRSAGVRIFNGTVSVSSPCRSSSSATVKGTVDVGGVAGQTNSSATLTACYATGNVIIEMDPKKNIAGGSLVGMNAGSSLLACYATGNVTSTGSSTGYMHIGGFLGNNYTTVTAGYWKNNHEQGIGYNRESTGATKVDGSVVTWQKAVDAMNTALQNAGSEWRYELKGALPTLRKQ